MKAFKRISEFVEHCKSIEGIVGILEYGSRTFQNDSIGGDYDLTVVFKDKKSFSSIAGIHFYINEIPVDCVIKSIDDFYISKPINKFDLVHLSCKILYDPYNLIKKALSQIRITWNHEVILTESKIFKWRFRLSHIINKLNHRLYEDELYSFYVLNNGVRIALDAYADINHLQLGLPKQHLIHIQENNNLLHSYIEQFYNTNNLCEKFNFIRLIFSIILNDIGGLWEKDEILFHSYSDMIPKEEKELITKIFFENS